MNEHLEQVVGNKPSTAVASMAAGFLKRVKLMFSVASATYKEWAAYRSHILVSLFVGPVYFLVQYFIWNAVFSHSGTSSGSGTVSGTINGFTLPQILTYYGIVTLINYCIMDFADWNLQMLIRTGRFVTFMIRPLSHRYFALAQKVGHRALGFTMEFIPVYMLFWLVFGIVLVPANIFWTLLSLLLGFLMMFYVDYCIGMTGFWLVKTGGVRGIFQLLRDIFAGAIIPLTFFPDALQKILFFLPFQYISYVPVRVFLGSYELAGMQVDIPVIVAYQAIALVIVWGISEIIWRLGIRKFTAVGI